MIPNVLVVDIVKKKKTLSKQMHVRSLKPYSSLWKPLPAKKVSDNSSSNCSSHISSFYNHILVSPPNLHWRSLKVRVAVSQCINLTVACQSFRALNLIKCLLVPGWRVLSIRVKGKCQDKDLPALMWAPWRWISRRTPYHLQLISARAHVGKRESRSDTFQNNASVEMRVSRREREHM